MPNKEAGSQAPQAGQRGMVVVVLLEGLAGSLAHPVLDGDAPEVSDGLDGLAQAHLVGQDHVVLRVPAMATASTPSHG